MDLRNIVKNIGNYDARSENYAYLRRIKKNRGGGVFLE